MKKLVTLVFIVSLTTFVKAQLPNFDRNFIIDTWTRGRCVIEITGTGYFTFGVNTLEDPVTFKEYRRAIAAKLNYNGDTVAIWQLGNPDSLFFNTYGYFPEVQFAYASVAADSNLLAMGAIQVYSPTTQYKHNLLLVKFDHNLDTLWTRIIPSPMDSSYNLNYIMATNDNCYLIGGIQEALTGIFNGLVMKVDANGNELWHNWYPTPYQNGIRGIAQTSSGDILCSGSNYQFGLGDPIIYKVDSNGNNQQMLQQFYSAGGDYGGQIINTIDSNFVFIADRKFVNLPSYLKYNHLIKLDANGAILFDKQFAPAYDGGFASVIQTSDLGYFTSGYLKYVQTGGLLIATVVKTNANGDSLWARLYTAPGHPTVFLDGKQTSDGGYVISGETYCCNTSSGNGYTSSLWVVKTDSLGFIITGVEDLPGFSNYKMGNVYPNPVTSVLNVSMELPQAVATATTMGKQGNYLYVFDMQGRQMAIQQLQTGTTTATLNVADLATGSYVVILVVDGYKIGSQKFVKE